MKLKEQNAWLSLAGFFGALLMLLGGYFITELLKSPQNETAIIFLFTGATVALWILIAIYTKVFK